MRHAPVQVTVIDRNNHYVFQPLLYQVATAYLFPADITAPIRNVLRRQQNTEVLLAEVTDVDVANRQVRIRDETTGVERDVPYDYLALATGAGQSYFGRDDWAAYAPTFKTIPDATALRRKVLLAFEEAEMTPSDAERVRSLLTFVIVGGGPTGVELAGAIAELQPMGGLAWRLPPYRRRVHAHRAGRGVAAPAQHVSRIAEREGRPEAGTIGRGGAHGEQVDRWMPSASWSRGERIAAATVMWTAGVTTSPAAQWLRAEADHAGRVIVFRDLSVSGRPEIFVLGDTAALLERTASPCRGWRPWRCNRVATSGRYRRGLGPGSPSLQLFRQGQSGDDWPQFAIADFAFLRVSGFIAWVLWLGIHILYLIGFRNRLLVMVQWAWAYFTYEHGARIITPISRQPEREQITAGRR